jgi:anti-sigma factor RsiW
MRWWPLRRRTRDPELACREMVELMTAYLDDALEPGQRAAFERHLASCPHCTEYLAQIRLVQEAAGRVEPEDVAPEARQDLMALYAQWRADPESGPAAEGSPEASE